MEPGLRSHKTERTLLHDITIHGFAQVTKLGIMQCDNYNLSKSNLNLEGLKNSQGIASQL